MLKKSAEAFSQERNRVLRYHGCLCFLNIYDLRDKIFLEACISQYSIHPEAMRIYRNIWEVYWLNGEKKNTVKFVAKIHSFQRVKVDQQSLEAYLLIYVLLLECQNMLIQTLLWVKSESSDKRLDLIIVGQYSERNAKLSMSDFLIKGINRIFRNSRFHVQFLSMWRTSWRHHFEVHRT